MRVFDANRKKKAPRRSADLDRARDIRETFQDSPSKRIAELAWTFPEELQYVGQCEAVMYVSNKWQKNPRDLQDYKHVAEGPQSLFVVPGFIRGYGASIEVCGPMIDVGGHTPDSLALLADVLGIQVRLLTRKGRGYQLPTGDTNLVQLDINGCKLGGAEHPKTGERFLVVYDASAVYCVITGEELDIEKDGITG